MSATDGLTEIERITRSGLQAALALARRLSLPATDPQVLSSRGNLLVRFAPAPVVARVATLSAWSRRDPFAWLAREVTVATYVAARGGPVVPPSGLADPGPHLADGYPISLWEYLPPSADRPGPAQTGALLADLHRAAAGCPGELGDLAPGRDQISDGLDALERESVLPADVIAELRDRHGMALAGIDGLGTAGVVHGDAHAGNLMAAAGGWRWIDLEETSRGPVEWDLAVLARHSGAGAAAALHGYAERAGRPAPTGDELAPFQKLRAIEAAVWTLCMAHRYPARYRAVAGDLLAAVVHD